MSESLVPGHVTIGWLYPASLRTYGDRGNVIALTQRAEWRGLEARVVPIEQHDAIPEDIDVFFIGGGQDRAQAALARTLVDTHGPVLRARLSEGASLLAICGGYQLLCHEYVTVKGEHIPGVGIFDAVTHASPGRLLGDVRLSTRWGEVVGFENHSGRTYLAAGVEPLGRVERGHGNNGEDGTEGLVSGRTIGSYLHGALLPRNPEITDWLLLQGIRRRDPAAQLTGLPDTRERATHGPFRSKRPDPPVKHSDRQPASRFTVVIPAFNEAAFLGRTLESLAEQDFAGTVEVIVVDNNSTDGTADIARSYGAQSLLEPRPGVCWARQRGTVAARGEIVLSTDADTVHPPDWLSRIDARFRDDERCIAVAGPCRFAAAPMWARLYPTVLFTLVHLAFVATGRVLYATATNIAFRRSAFVGYDTALTQGGDELGLLRSLRGRGRIIFDKQNVVTTSSRRLRRGLVYNLFVTLIFYYLVGYLVNRLASRTVLPTAPPCRDDTVRRPRLALLIGVPLTLGCLLKWVV